MIGVLGWDIGGANVKAARLAPGRGRAGRTSVVSRPFEIWRDKKKLPAVLRSISAELSGSRNPGAYVVTMTAELSDVFETKREGVRFVLESVQSCFPKIPGYALNLSGEVWPLSRALESPLDYAATNWVASATWVAEKFPGCLLVDVGGTTTDLVPIVDGRIRTGGRTDMDRLASGELVFTGALRTNLAAVVQSVPVAGRRCRVASEYFAVSGDVHLILGHLRPRDYTCSTPDGRAPSVESARGRLARLVGADAEMLSAADIDSMARFIADRQVDQIAGGMRQVLSRFPVLRGGCAVIAGCGEFLGAAAARSVGLEPTPPGGGATRAQREVLPSVAAARLLAKHLEAASR